MAITKATIVDGKLTIQAAALDAGAKTLALSYQGEAGDENETTLDTLKDGGKYYSDITSIDATKLKVPLELDLTNSSVTEVTGGKGADIYTIDTTSGNSFTINSFGTTDSIKLSGATELPEIMTAGFTFANTVILTLGDTTLNLVGATGSLVNILDKDGNSLFSQSFQDDDTYTITNANTGSVLTSDKATITSNKRSSPITINATYTTATASITGGTGADTISVIEDGAAQIAGGKGNDTFIVTEGNNLTITDYEFGGTKDVIKVGAGLTYEGNYKAATNGTDIVLYFTANNEDGTKNTQAASVTVKNALWDQISKDTTKKIKIVDSTGAEKANKAFENPAVLVVTGKLDKGAEINLATDTKIADQDIGSAVRTIQFNGSTAVSITGGGPYQVVQTGGGADTIRGTEEASGGTQSVTDVVEAGTFTSTEYPVFETDEITFKYTGTLSDGEHDIYVKLTYTSGVTDSAAKVSEVFVLAEDGTPSTLTINEDTTNGDHPIGNLTFTFEKISTLATKTFDVRGLATTTPGARTEFAEEISEYLWDNGTNGTTVVYTYDPSTAYDGGKGNDYLYGYNGGGKFYGNDGVDTLRGGKGNTTLTGGAGNDVFLLTGEGKVRVTEEEDGEATDSESTTHTIRDYNSGAGWVGVDKKDANYKALNKDRGTDKIQVAWDNYKTKNLTAGVSGKASVVGGALTENGLEVQVQGVFWEDSVAADTEAGTAAKFADFGTEAQEATYVFSSLGKDSIVSIIDQGITYKQVVGDEDTDGKVVMDATNYSNYLGKLNDDAITIDASAMTRAQRLVAGNSTTSIVGATNAVSTIIGNGQTTMTGGSKNDIFVVQNGDAVTNYGTGKDVIRLADGIEFSDLNNVTVKAKNDIATISSVTADGSTAGKYNVVLSNGDTAVVVVDATTITEITVEQAEGNSNAYRTNLGLDLTTITLAGTTATNIKDALQSAINTIGRGGIVYEQKAVATGDDATTVTGEKVDVVIGGISLENVGGKDVTFNQVYETKTEGSKKTAGTYVGTKVNTNTMIRKFSDSDSLVGGKGNYLEAYNGVDSDVKVIIGGATAASIVNGAANVESILGGAKNDTIVVGRNAGNMDGTVMTVTSGKGNDVIIWDGEQNIVVTDYTKAAWKNNKVSSGDVILLDGFTTDKLDYSYSGSDVIITAKDGAKDGKVTLQGAKDMTAYITSADGYDATATVAADKIATLANPNEYIIDAKVGYKTDSVTAAIQIVNGVNAAKQDIDVASVTGNVVKTIYGGKGVDTVHAGAVTDYIDVGAGNDIVFTKGAGASDVQTITTGAGNDIIAFNEVTSGANIIVTDYTVGSDKIFLGSTVSIASAAFGGDGDFVTTTKNNSYYSDVTLTLTDGNNTEEVTFKNVEQLVETLNKSGAVTKSAKSGTLTVVRDNTGDNNPSNKAANLTTYSMDYANGDVTVASSALKSAGTSFDLTGANALNITIDKSGKNVNIKNARAGAEVSVGDGGKNPVFFYGNAVETDVSISTAYYYQEVTGAGQVLSRIDTIVGGAYFKGNNALYDSAGNVIYPETTYGEDAVIFNGSAGADVYYGNGAWDTVNLGAGNDTFRAGDNGVVRAQIKGSGSFSANNDTKTKSANTFVVGAGDEYHIDNFGYLDNKNGADQILLDSNSSAYSSTYDTDTKDLTLVFQTTEATNDAAATYGTVIISDYKLGSKIKISQLGTNNKGKEVVNNYSNLSYGSQTLAITKDDISPIIVDNNIIGTDVTVVNASTRTSAAKITGSATTAEIIGGSAADVITFDSAINNATVTGGKGNDTFIFTPGTYATASTKTLTVTDYLTGTNIVSVEGAFAGEGDLADYSAKVNFVANDDGGVDLVLKDEGKVEVVLKDAVTVAKNGTRSASKITINGNKNLSFSDPENVVLTNKSATNFSAAGVGDRVKTMNASKAATGVTLVAGTVLTSYTGSAKGDTVTLSTATGASNVAITSGAGNDKFAFGAGNDKYTYNGGADEITNFAASGDDEINLNGWTVNTDGNNISIVTMDGEDEGVKLATVKVELTKKGAKGTNTLQITGVVGDNFKVSQDDSSYEIKGLGSYGTSESEMKAFVETSDLYNDFVKVDSLSDITAKTVDEAAIAVDLTTDFAKSGNTFDVATALASQKKSAK